MIDELREYIANCPHLKEFAELNIEYLVDKVETYSINEIPAYNPVLSQDILGNQDKQFLFTFDSKLRWNEDAQNNIDNSKFCENFRKWLEENNKNKIFPNIKGIYEIGTNTNGYIFATSANEAIYRIQCYLKYFKEG